MTKNRQACLSNSTFKPIRVLHVDDDLDFLDTSKQILELDGNILVTSVSSVNEALQFVLKQDFDVIVSDFQMPEKDGLVFLAQLRESDNHTPFILFTGKGREEVAVKALNLGANYYINKIGKPETVYGELSHYVKQIFNKNAAEKMLKEHEDRLKKIAEQTPGMLYQFKMSPDGSFCVPFSTDGIKDVFGCSPDEVKTDLFPITEVLFAEDKDRVLQSIVDSAEKLKLWRSEFRVQFPGGPVRWMLGSSKPEKHSDGSILWNGYIVDITEQKKALEDVKFQKRMLENVTENTRSGLSVISKDFDVVYANKVLVNIFGDVIGKKCYSTFGYGDSICPNCGVKQIFETGKDQVVHNRVIHSKNGNVVYLSLVATVIKDETGKIVGATEIALDVTKQKLKVNQIRESEQKFRILAEQSPNMIFINQKGKVVYANKKCEEVTGYTKDEFYDPSFDFVCLIAPQDKEKVMKNFCKHMNGEDVPPVEYSIVSKHGDVIQGILCTKLILYAGKNAILGTITEITEYKRAEEKIEAMVKSLQIVNEKLNIVGKSTRHDAANKLSVILNNVYLAKMRLPENQVEIRKYLLGVENAVVDINRIFDFSRVFQQLGSEKLEEIDVGEVFENAVSSFLKRKDDLLILNDCKGLKLFADSLLETLFYNLVENSLKHGKKVTSLALRYADLDDELVVFYEDNGIGIDETEKEKVFSEGYGKGTGIGLHLVRLMCNVYGWSIDEVGVPGNGVQFRICIPKRLVPKGEVKSRVGVFLE
ncbi:MAG: PAS domain S-box protein [Candidatus Bathyarchaeota archaeon]|nr:PAS domain S-box protein [Candidatus Bathyarchaeum tardum]